MKAIYLAIVVLLVLGTWAVLKRHSRKQQPLPVPASPSLPEAGYAVTFDETAVKVRYPDGEVRSLAWDALGMVGIRTTDEGPFAPDVFWGLHDRDGQPRLIYPGGAAGEGELLAEMQRRLAGFDNQQLIEAMTSASQAFFLVWKSGEEEQAA